MDSRKETDSELDRQTDRETERQASSQTDRQTQREIQELTFPKTKSYFEREYKKLRYRLKKEIHTYFLINALKV